MKTQRWPALFQEALNKNCQKDKEERVNSSGIWGWDTITQ
jgi:hypothetical protein